MTVYSITTSNTPVRPRDEHVRPPAITTNNVTPVQPVRPAVLKPAQGPVITTENVGVVRQSPAITRDGDVRSDSAPFRKKPGRKPKG